MMKNATLLLYSSLGFLFHSCQPSTENQSIKNVVVILADDHALKVTGCYGNEIIRTPNIDRLSAEGVLFTHAYCNAPISSASRQSLLTGKYPHATGVTLLYTPFPDKGNTTISEHLRNHGYKTALIGKTHFNHYVWSPIYKDGMPDHGFDINIEELQYQQYLQHNPSPRIHADVETYDRSKILRTNIPEWLNCRNLPHAIYDEYSSGTFFARQAVNFINQNRKNPFFLWVAFFQPHQPYYYPVEYAEKYNPEDMPLPKGSQEDDRWIPEQFKNLTDEQKKGLIAAYYTSTEYLDKNIGLILDAIKANSIDKNTLVIYISDNGYLLYEHKRFEKHTMWEEAIRQPMIVKAGNLFEKGTKKNALVEYIDVIPTILDIIGQKPIKEVQGKSFLPVLTNKTDEHKDFAFSEYLEDNLAMVCTKKWKYMFTTGSRILGLGYATGYGPTGIIHRLYDLEYDPQEMHDLSENAESREILVEMQQQMLRRFIETHPDAANCPEDLTLEGKLVWFCEPRDIGCDPSDAKPVRVKN